VRTAVSIPPFTDASTWLIDSVWPVGDWVADLRGRVAAGA
jgi:hypothetical protein